jgi:trigger factor
VTVHDEEIARALKDLRVMRATETVTTNASRPTDLVVVDMDMKLNGVPLDGGQTKGHRVYLDEPYYIPGLTAQLTGVKKDEVKNFSLDFPKDHYQKNVAGKPVEFIITVKDVFERTLPEVNDEFAKALGQKDVADLSKLIHENLLNEAKQKESQREEIAALEEIVKNSKFGDLPEKLVNEEVRRMIAELKDGITQRGMDWNQYLADAKKDEAQIALDLVPQAIGRIKVALIVRAVAQAESIEVDDTEVATEVERQMNLYSDDAETQAQIRTEDYQDRMRMVLRNRKVVEFIKNLIVK